MKVEWNRVTWYSKAIALAVVVILPLVGFWLGFKYGVRHQYAIDAATIKNLTIPTP